MKIIVSTLALACFGFLSACATDPVDHTYPKTWQDQRREDMGKVTEHGGILDYFTDGSGASGSKGATIGVNSYLWRASLDTISFMPLKNADPFGGVIITDWYEDQASVGERFKVDVLIMATTLQSDGVKVSVFKQRMDRNGDWRDEATPDNLSRDLEDIILTRARELKRNSKR